MIHPTIMQLHKYKNPPPQPKHIPPPKLIENIDLNSHNEIQRVLSKELNKHELLAFIAKIKKHERDEKQVENIIYLNNLKKQLKSRLSINVSKEIIQACVQTAEQSQKNRKQLDFNNLDREIKKTGLQIYKKKYYVKKYKTNGNFCLKKPQSADKRRNGNMNTSNNLYNKSHLRTFKNLMSLDEIFIKENSNILKSYIPQDELEKFEQELLNKIQNIENQYYGKYNERIKQYTIYDNILKKVFSLIQDDTKNIEIRTKNAKIYRKIKEKMIAIVINEEDIKESTKLLRKAQTQKNLSKNCIKPSQKKNYFQLDRQKMDLNIQIQEALQSAKRNLKQAFIKRKRPDYAYELQLQFQNRATYSGDMIEGKGN